MGQTRSILTTGVTGFLGARLTASLLAATSATVFCLVRGRSTEGAAKRMQARLSALGVPAEHRTRVVPVFGDLGVPGLGMPPADFDELADSVRTIYHCAARLSMVSETDRLSAINVGGTETMLRLAERGDGTVLHFVSTLGTLGASRQAGQPRVDESAVPTEVTAGGVGYTTSKMVAENTVRAAMRRGLPAVIHRPGLILGETATGACLDSDILVRIIRTCAEIGLAPRCPGWVPAATVDHVVRSITALGAADPALVGSTFHLADSRPLLLHQVFRHMRTAGYMISEIPTTEWEQVLREHPESTNCFAVLAMWKAVRYLLGTDPDHLFPQVSCDRTAGVLAQLGVPPSPPPDETLFHRMFEHLSRTGHLDTPPVLAAVAPG
ncbi:hypothetical protein ALI144C_31015 [Actinosynnema sp. ALI-1.44]|uniref:thioester reductase domain-containing protein n=1 Tax=Actinosynnema sp. ALI-1.44 TaxID=1933779 RepID=UPI00097C2D70|nr:thioester reductase domain-containing protein [Actinosynnema sp. ALI-1.44]ONI77853.1 hypothetical protein ALI144C_31015 [Actinosynnema sp. ALI-1.44]